MSSIVSLFSMLQAAPADGGHTNGEPSPDQAKGIKELTSPNTLLKHLDLLLVRTEEYQT